MPAASYPLLDRISGPADLRGLNSDELVQLAAELREFLIQTVATRGGHFAAGLGTVELTIALHHVFDTPYDRIVWDVGHQAYPHKVLTGRREQLHTIKQKGGLSPLSQSRRERLRHLRHRPFQHLHQRRTGHGSGRSPERRTATRRGGDRRRCDERRHGLRGAEPRGHVAGGPAGGAQRQRDVDLARAWARFEGLLRARAVGASFYAQLRKGGKKVLSQMPTIRELARRSEEHMKGMVLPGTMFEEMGFNYIGPIDGHDMKALVSALSQHARPQGTAVPARGHDQGQGLRACRGRPDHLAWPRPIRSGQRHHLQGKGQLHPLIRRSSATG